MFKIAEKGGLGHDPSITNWKKILNSMAPTNKNDTPVSRGININNY